MRVRIGVVMVGLLALLASGHAAAREPLDPEAPHERALDWLAEHQNEDGSWGGLHTTAVTSLACLAWLAHDEEPYDGKEAQPLLRGLTFLLSQQKDGVFPKQGHTWIHGQGFATLALAEAYGRTLFCTHAPDLDVAKLKKAVTQAVATIAAHQSVSGGWWYVQGSPHGHEGSTTVCAVQALVSAANFGIEIDKTVLAKGFEYLKRCQNPDGGFDYKEGPGTVSMKEGTAGDVATLALMRKFDYQVMTRGVDFLKAVGPQGISKERFPYYGHFYAAMGLVLFGEEMGAEQVAQEYVDGAVQDVLTWQAEDGSWPLKGWMLSKPQDAAYGTAFAALLLAVPEKRLSIFRRRPPELPKRPSESE